MAKIDVKGTSVTVISGGTDDYISLTDIARYKDCERTDYIIQNWLRNRNTIEFLGIWEQLNNPGFNPIEFDGIRNQAGYFYDDFRSGGVRHTGRVQPDNSLVFAPFDPKKRYKQVLVQCEAGESLENDRVRFLLLAGDTLVEVAAEQPYKASIFVRHYRRVPTGSGA